MKTLLLVRHAKSSWADQGLDDFDRPLNDRGKKDAPEMAKRLNEKNIVIDLIISSPAKRARRTAKIFAEELDLKKKEVEFFDNLYMAGPSVFQKTIAALSDKLDTVALVAHNPGITEFANTLTHVRIDNIPTTGVFAIQADTDSWKNFSEAPKSFLFFDFPKSEQGSA